jgi:hypothetical protein
LHQIDHRANLKVIDADGALIEWRGQSGDAATVAGNGASKTPGPR